MYNIFRFENLPHSWSLGGFEDVSFFAAAYQNIIHIYNLLNYKKNKYVYLAFVILLIMMNLNLSVLCRIKLGSKRTVTVVQCHPTSSILAIGDNTGRIVLYNNVLHKNAKSQTVYHWHTLPVNDVIFTSSGKSFKTFSKINSVIIYFFFF